MKKIETEMHTYYFAELQNRHSYRQAEKISATSLKDAQRIALSKQFFRGTVIEISNHVNRDGFILKPRCVYENGAWLTQKYNEEFDRVS